MNRRDLANKIWHACDIMRRDDGTTGVLEYMEQLSWMIFLKVFEDLEKRFEDEAKFEGRDYEPIIDPKFRWSAWANKSDKELEEYFSEEELNELRASNEHILIAFINRKLFPYLRSLKGTPEKERIASIFQEITGNRMKSPYNLRDVISILDEIDFNKAEDSHVLSQVYEELLLRLGKEGGVAGEFYTPRPVVRLMVKIVDPAIGERVFDPFCGSGGFLVESYKRMLESKELTIEDYELLQYKTFYGQEKKPLPYLFGVMNCIVHGLLHPNIVRKNTLEENIRSVPEAERFEVILTNPPFGGKEGKHIRQNFPYPSSKTEILALQYVMRKLKKGGRCGIVVPEGILFNTSEKAFVNTKRDLLENYNVHTIISLPSGVFANVTASGQGPKTNLVFFTRDGPTKEIWYFDFAGYSEVVLKKKYTKANPVTDEDLAVVYEAWKKREIGEWSWVVPVEEIIENDYDMTARNPNRKEEISYPEPIEIVESIAEKEKEINVLLEELKHALGGGKP
ncbi:MAG: SAM-dependent DNA methyltransferase [Archaeoglobus sp.]|uniref:type I restriction-modification system subunit M n=1 Tax=Archaeoglobus sp. TaxID=1872626 RepID=UPI001D405C1D|nr:class I SAM-dependent DNA methyltransferase [Archaeoglobus sp.]MBO8179740.1 SAM-dependent DNA methyltransferase [Archaeoglobus sp.]